MSIISATTTTTPSDLVHIVQILCSIIRSLRKPHSKIVALAMSLRLSRHCTDEVLVHRILPAVMAQLVDSVATVRASGVRALRGILGHVRAVTALESNVFPRVICPALSRLVKDPEVH